MSDISSTISSLEIVLASSYALYLKTQQFHWNVTGPHFASYHALFEEQYSEYAEAIDVIAERIRTLGAPTPGGFAIFATLSVIEDSSFELSADDMIRTLVNDQSSLCGALLDTLAEAEEIGDQVTVDLMIQRLAVHEKHSWMLRSTLEE